MPSGTSHAKNGVLARILLGATGLLVPLSAMSPAAAFPEPDRYCPLTGIRVHGDCAIKGRSSDATASGKAADEQSKDSADQSGPKNDGVSDES